MAESKDPQFTVIDPVSLPRPDVRHLLDDDLAALRANLASDEPARVEHVKKIADDVAARSAALAETSRRTHQPRVVDGGETSDSVQENNRRGVWQEPEDTEGTLSENPGSELEAELRDKWSKMRGNPEAKFLAVKEIFQEWKEMDGQIRQFSDESMVRMDLTKSDLEPSRIEKILNLALKNDEAEVRLEAIREHSETSPDLSDLDAGFLTAHYHAYHQLLAAARKVVREREQKTAMTAAEAEQVKVGAVSAPENNLRPEREREMTISEKVAHANKLVEEWVAIRSQVADGKL